MAKKSGNPGNTEANNPQYQPNQDVKKGWASKLFLPPPVLSQMVPFVSMWAVDGFGALSVPAERNSYLQGSPVLDTGKFHITKDPITGAEITKEHMVQKLSTIKCRFVSSHYSDMNHEEVTLVPIFSNVSQLLTKDMKGGVGLTNFSVQYQSHDPMIVTAQATIEIQNVFDLANSSLSVTKILQPGGLYVFVAGWQMQSYFEYDRFYYDAGGEKINLVLPPQFDEMPGEFFVLEDSDKTDSSGKPLKEPVMYIDLFDSHFGYMQAYLLTLENTDFQLDANRMIASCRFTHSAGYFGEKIKALQMQNHFASELYNHLHDYIVLSHVTRQPLPVVPKPLERKGDGIVVPLQGPIVEGELPPLPPPAPDAPTPSQAPGQAYGPSSGPSSIVLGPTRRPLPTF